MIVANNFDIGHVDDPNTMLQEGKQVFQYLILKLGVNDADKHHHPFGIGDHSVTGPQSMYAAAAVDRNNGVSVNMLFFIQQVRKPFGDGLFNDDFYADFLKVCIRGTPFLEQPLSHSDVNRDADDEVEGKGNAEGQSNVNCWISLR